MLNINFNYSNHRSQSPGYLLIESLITLLIISGIGLYISYWYVNIVTYQNEIMMRDKAINLACSVVDYIKIHKNLTGFKSFVDDNKFNVKYELKKVHSGFSFVYINVFWQTRTSAQHISLVGGFS